MDGASRFGCHTSLILARLVARIFPKQRNDANDSEAVCIYRVPYK